MPTHRQDRRLASASATAQARTHGLWPAAQACCFSGFSGTICYECADFKGVDFNGAVRHRMGQRSPWAAVQARTQRL